MYGPGIPEIRYIGDALGGEALAVQIDVAPSSGTVGTSSTISIRRRVASEAEPGPFVADVDLEDTIIASGYPVTASMMEFLDPVPVGLEFEYAVRSESLIGQPSAWSGWHS